MKHSDSFSAIAAALAKAAAEFQPIKKDRTVTVKTKKGGEYTFAYAPLESIVAAVRPALSASGLVLVQSVVSEDFHRGQAVVSEDFLETRLLHSSGEWLANLTPVMVDPEESSAQAYGSAITYARRYGITQLLCVVADEDDDGNAASGNVARSARDGASASGGGRTSSPISDKQAALLRVRLKQIKGSETALCVAMKVEALEALPRMQMDAAMQLIDTKSPELFADTGKSDAELAAARRKEQHDIAADKHGESLVAIRYHLGLERSHEIDHAGDELGLGDRDETKALREWRQLGDQAQSDLWLAPTKGGWLTTAEREAIRALSKSEAPVENAQPSESTPDTLI